MQRRNRINDKRENMNKKVFLYFFAITLVILLGVVCFIFAIPLLFKESPFQSFFPSATPTSTPLPTPTPTPLPEARIHEADIILLEGDYDRASQLYDTGLTTASSIEAQVSAMLGLGHVQYLQKDYQRCLQSFGTVLASYPSKFHAPAHYFLAQCQLALGNSDKAIEHLDAYLAANPGVIDSYVLEEKADLLLNGLKFDPAFTTLTNAAQAALNSNDTVRLKVRAADIYFQQKNYDGALQLLVPLYDLAQDNYTRAHINYVLASSYFNMGLPEQAYARFQDSVNNFPQTVDAFNSVVFLVDHNIPVDPFSRGMVNYHAGQYGMAADYFKAYLAGTPEHKADAHHYRALSLRGMDLYDAAIAEWREIINTHSDDILFRDAYEEIAYTQWAFMNQFDRGSQTLLEYVGRMPAATDATQALYDAARILERNSNLAEAAAIWERMINEYPSDPLSQRGLMLSGITRYRMNETGSALTTFQRALVLASAKADRAAASFWIGKTQQKLGDKNAAMAAYQQAADADPTGYYSERAREIIDGKQPLTFTGAFNYYTDLEAERELAETWLRYTFNIPAEANLRGEGPLATDRNMRAGTAFWEIGDFKRAADYYSRARKSIEGDAVANYHFINVVYPKGFYQQAIYASREILDLANLDDAGTLAAPIYFNHIRFGTYFPKTVEAAAKQYGVHPLVLWSMIRQESMFTPFAGSSAGAHGALQLLPTTAQDVVTQLNWPPNYSSEDLFRPVINIPLGAAYYQGRLKQFDGDAISALAAYNGGPGNAMIWNDLAGGDPDLMLEVVRFAETRSYIMQISEFAHIYEKIYQTR